MVRMSCLTWALLVASATFYAAGSCVDADGLVSQRATVDQENVRVRINEARTELDVELYGVELAVNYCSLFPTDVRTVYFGSNSARDERRKKAAEKVLEDISGPFSASAVILHQRRTTFEKAELTIQIVPEEQSERVGIIVAVPEFVNNGLCGFKVRATWGTVSAATLLLSNSPGVWSVIVQKTMDHVEIVTVRPERRPASPIYRPMSRSTRAPRRQPLLLLGRDLGFVNYRAVLPNKRIPYFVVANRAMFVQRLLNTGELYELWQRSQHPDDIAYAKSKITKIKRPFDPLEVYFLTQVHPELSVQTILCIDKNGYIGIIVNVERTPSEASLRAFDLSLILNAYDQIVWNRILPFRAVVVVREDAHKTSNIGEPGTFVFTLSQDGKLMGPRARSNNLYRLCRGRAQPALNHIEGVRLPGGSFVSQRGRFTRASEQLLLSMSWSKSRPRRKDLLSSGFKQNPPRQWANPHEYCYVLRRGDLGRLQRDVRRSSVAQRRFVAYKALAMSFVAHEVNNEKSGVAEVLFVQGRNGKIAYILNVPPAINWRISFSNKLTSLKPNGGKPGRYIIVE